MIERNDIARAARYADAEVEEIGLKAWGERYEISLNGMLYVAQQRALRAAVLRDGKNPRQLPQTHITHVNLSQSSRAEMPTLTAVWLDGFAIGVRAARDDERFRKAIS